MSELELALTRLGREVEYPETPDLTGVVRRRLAEGRRRTFLAAAARDRAGGAGRRGGRGDGRSAGA